MSKNILYIILSILLTSCAARYKTLELDSLNYASFSNEEEIKLSYKYNVLPKKYYRKQRRKDIKVVALKIENNTDKDLVLGDNLNLVDDSGNILYTLDNETIFKNLKQYPLTHLLYLLLTPLNFHYTDDFGSDEFGDSSNQRKSFPIGLILGPGLAGSNIAVARLANKRFQKDLSNYNLKGRNIKKGSTKYGLIAIKADNFKSLKLKIAD